MRALACDRVLTFHRLGRPASRVRTLLQDLLSQRLALRLMCVCAMLLPLFMFAIALHCR